MIANKYSIIKKINEGTFGIILKGKNIRTSEYVAIKIESKIDIMVTLKTEAKIYQYLGKQLGFPQLKWFGSNDTFNYLVLDLLGPSLQTIVNTCGPALALQYGMQIIRRIETLHSKSLLHRDIKPHNFLFGLGKETNKIYLIDFGFCKRYEYNGHHILQKTITSIIGSPNFVSLNVHNFIEPSRRDDVESCLYIILYMYAGYLEWIDLNISRENMIELKRELTNNSIPLFIKTLLQYCRQLLFNETPNYEYIVSILQSELNILMK
jgi:serine/threonine protein kinase